MILLKQCAVSYCSKSPGLLKIHLKVLNLAMPSKSSAVLESENPTSIHKLLKN